MAVTETVQAMGEGVKITKRPGYSGGGFTPGQAYEPRGLVAQSKWIQQKSGETPTNDAKGFVLNFKETRGLTVMFKIFKTNPYCF